MLSEDQAIEIFKTLADANRLQLFRLLLRSDHANSELMEHTQLSQNLLSHHLNVLSSAGLIQARRSVGDARRHYYSANLGMVCAFGDWWDNFTFCKGDALPELANPPHLLFLCLRNSSRSLMAEAVARHIAPHTLSVWSAGFQPGGKIEPGMIQVLNEHHISTDSLQPLTFDKLGKQTFDYVITVCDIVHETNLPDSLQHAEVIHWSLLDPVASSLDPLRQLDEMRRLYDDIVQRLTVFVQRVILDTTAQP